jgi:hypothetical protein
MASPIRFRLLVQSERLALSRAVRTAGMIISQRNNAMAAATKRHRLIVI